MSKSSVIVDYYAPSRCNGRYDAPGECPFCQSELIHKGSEQRYCGNKCRKEVLLLPLEERETRRAATPLGTCVGCGTGTPLGSWGCPKWKPAPAPAIRALRQTAKHHVRFCEEAWEWLAAKTGLPKDDDERLRAVAEKFVEAGLIGVIVRSGQIVAMAKMPMTATRETTA